MIGALVAIFIVFFTVWILATASAWLMSSILEPLYQLYVWTAKRLQPLTVRIENLLNTKLW
jgi:hypothetical protein